MGWIQYFNLLEKYNGDFSKATKEEMGWAEKGNPNDPVSALRLATEKFEKKKVGEK